MEQEMTGLEAMARAMCVAAGDDPDLLAYPPMQHNYARGRNYVLVVPTAEYLQPRPLWQAYVREARAALEAFKDYPPVFGDIGKRVGSLMDLYMQDRTAWSKVIDSMLEQKFDA
jgi:hypothetical protein